MHIYLSLCGLFAGFVALVHLILGEKTVVRPFRKAPMDATVRHTMHACWHLVSVDLVVKALALLAMGLAGSTLRPLIVFIAIHYIAYGLVFIVVAMTSDLEGAFKKLPQWALLAPLGVALLFAN